MPKVSIIIPVFKAEKYIVRTIQSLQQQSLSDIEMIFVDDCGGDNSSNIILDCAQNDGRIRLLQHEQNLGPSVARLDGYMSAKGDYIAFMDSDDTMPSDALELLCQKAIKENADLVIGNYSKINEDGTIDLKQNMLCYGTTPSAIYKSLLRGECAHSLCGKLYKRELLCNHEYETRKNHTNGEDAVLFYQLVINTTKVVTLNDSVYYYYQNVGSSTHVKLSEKALDDIYFSNSFTVKMTSEYDGLRRDLTRRMIMRHVNSIRNGYDKTLVLSLEKKYGLYEFYNRKNIHKYFKLSERIGLYKQLWIH